MSRSITVASRHVPESRDPGASGRVDWLGAALGALGLAGLTLGLSEQRWPAAVIGVVVLSAFVVTEWRTRHPLVPLAIFRSRTFSGANVVTLLLYGSLGVVFFLLGLVLQGPLGYTPLQAGAATMPVTLAMLGLSARAGALAQRIGPRIPMTVGPLLVATSLIMLTGITAESTYVAGILPGIVVFGLGLSLTVAPLTATALGAVEDHRAGVASGVNNAVARTGQLLAVAAIPVIAGFAPGAAVAGAELLDGFDRVMRFAAVAVVGAACHLVGDGPPTARVTRAQLATTWHCAAGGPPALVDGPVAIDVAA